jgi:biotin-(acetyl-CoA carboxylase) ligase
VRIDEWEGQAMARPSDPLDSWVRRYRDEGAGPVVAAWRERDALTGRHVRACGQRGNVEGRAIGIDSFGHLVLQASGQSRPLVGEETLVVE